jgi:hypothetical protein
LGRGGGVVWRRVLRLLCLKYPPLPNASRGCGLAAPANCVCVCMGACVYMCMYVCACVCLSVYVCNCMSVCLCNSVRRQWRAYERARQPSNKTPIVNGFEDAAGYRAMAVTVGLVLLHTPLANAPSCCLPPPACVLVWGAWHVAAGTAEDTVQSAQQAKRWRCHSCWTD